MNAMKNIFIFLFLLFLTMLLQSGMDFLLGQSSDNILDNILYYFFTMDQSEYVVLVAFLFLYAAQRVRQSRKKRS
ncbi:hypothetical protein SAMN06264849_103275 [Melghirimyces algeriensis]|uniref:Uncharacterized protein n=1 Tax=Melghirimyces algeriensis TaxID=910412 RepID=A0A521CCM2_9BACL|nr:hypothetical protein SAMN06264849_103275 [Melghirimyces algeriensis]